MKPSLTDMQHGPQPLDRLLEERHLDHADLVSASTEHLTHKQVAKARRGRAVTRNIQMKILRALRTVTDEETLALTDLFTYRGRL